MTIAELAREIKYEVKWKLWDIYNWRKQKLGLISSHNTLINNLSVIVDEWYEKQLKKSDRIERLIVKEAKEG